MSVIAEIIILGTLISALYALVALGFTMIFGVAGVLNMSHGALAMLGAYLAIWALRAGAEVPLAYGLAVLGMAVIAPLLYRVFVRRILDRPIIVFLATLLLAILLEQVVIFLESPNPRNIPPLIAGGFELFDIRVSYNRLLASVLAVICIIGLWLFVQRTRTGQAILALSMDRKGAALVGIPSERIVTVVWAISGALAALAGVFIASFFGISPLEERVLLVIAFSIVILGGLGSIPGTLGAALIIGFSETAVVQLAPELRGLAPLVILLIVLSLRPQGLLGRAPA